MGCHLCAVFPPMATTSDIKRVGDSGIYTAEGMLAGGRAAKLSAAREVQVAEYEKTRKKIEVCTVVAGKAVFLPFRTCRFPATGCSKNRNSETH